MIGLQQVYGANSAAIIFSKQRMRYCSWCQDQYGGLEHLHFGRGSIIRHSLQHPTSIIWRSKERDLFQYRNMVKVFYLQILHQLVAILDV